MIEALVLTSMVEVLVYLLPGLRTLKKLVAIVLIPFVTVLTVLVLASNLSLFVLLGAIGSIYRVVNMARVIKGRMHERYLKRASLDSAILLGLLQTALFAVDLTVRNHRFGLLLPLLVLQVIFAVVIFFSLLRNLRKTSSSAGTNKLSDSELPTVSVAIPARNETRDLEECLRSVLASDYPKLEIIVLDDCSHKETADIIKSFAHDGVRFVQGYDPSNDWLAKNLAYDRLADESRGEYILFCGVDVRFAPGAIREMVNELLARKKEMLSVLPYRIESSNFSAITQPIRYWWELALPRRLFNRPPVLSTCWLIHRPSLEKKGGFEAVRRSIIPERYFARELAKDAGYSFLRSSGKMDIKTVKKLSSSKETAERIRYPQLDKKPENIYIATILESVLLLGPVALSVFLLVTNQSEGVISLASSVLLILSHVLIIQNTNPKKTLFALFGYPLTVIADILLMNISMYKYEFSVVDWKGRNLCTPVMHVYPKLPDIYKKSRKKH